jgi:hypothetical protein
MFPKRGIVCHNKIGPIERTLSNNLKFVDLFLGQWCRDFKLRIWVFENEIDFEGII